MTMSRDNAGQVMQIADWSGYKTVAIGATSTQSAALTAGTRAVRVCSTVDCYLIVGTNPTATTTSGYLPALRPELISLEETEKLAVLQVTTGGVLSIVEIT